MRILHIVTHLPRIGSGIVNVAVDLACLQRKNGLAVAVASGPLGPDVDNYQNLLNEYGVQHYDLDQSRKFVTTFKALVTLYTIIQDFQPDIVHVHMMTGLVLAKLLQPFGHYKLVSTIHNVYQKSSDLMGWADHAICVAHAAAIEVGKRGIAAHKISVVQNGPLGSPRIDSARINSPIDLYHPAIVTVAQLSTRKGAGDLLKAFNMIASEHRDVHLYWVGNNGADHQLFRSQASHSPYQDRIHFEGYQPEPQRYLLAADIFVLASHRETNPLVIPEAREAGCAIVATNVDGIPEALDHGNAGLLVPPCNSQELAKTVLKLLNNPDLSAEYKFKAKQNLQYYSVERVYQETNEVYKKLTVF
jgi:glycosyltransferase involved in cell wall biosynthesis